MAKLTLDLAQTIIAKARERARELDQVPLGYAVVDAGGHVVALAREDGAGFLRSEIAFAKAWGCFALGFSSRALRDRSKGWDSFFTGIAGVAGGRLVPSPGGVFIRDADGAALGAVGISGAPSDVDEALAVHGIEAVGLKADTA
jgi:uncharacterized protein GlcG (DUF336 family)